MRKAPTPKWMPTETGLFTPQGEAPFPVCRQGKALFFSLTFPIKKGKKRNNQAAKGHQQC